MIAMEINYEKIYENLGHLFYAIAAADEKVRPEEIQQLKTVVQKNAYPWKNLLISTAQTPRTTFPLLLTIY